MPTGGSTETSLSHTLDVDAAAPAQCHGKISRSFFLIPLFASLWSSSVASQAVEAANPRSRASGSLILYYTAACVPPKKPLPQTMLRKGQAARFERATSDLHRIDVQFLLLESPGRQLTRSPERLPKRIASLRSP